MIKIPLPFTEKQMKQVFDTNIIDLAVQYGMEIEKGDANTVHVKNSGGLYIFKHGRGYNCFSGGKGNIIAFAREYLGAKDFKSAVELILGCRAYEQTTHLINPTEKMLKGDLILPPQAENFDLIIDYLTEIRCIDKEIINTMIQQKKLYQSKFVSKSGHVFYNCAFVGYDSTNKARSCFLRAPYQNSKFRQDVVNSDKSYGFCMEGNSNRVYSFEASIDALSHATLCKFLDIDWKADHRVSEGCLSDNALERYLKAHSEIDEIVFCYDNDINGKLADGTPHNHGQIQANIYAKKYKNLGYKTFIQTPETKDFNNDLITFLALLEQEHLSKENFER